MVPNATWTDNGDGTGLYVFTPDAGQVGLFYDLEFYVVDPGGLGDTIDVRLTAVTFLRGDVDSNNKYTMNDLADLISFVYRQGPPPPIPESADVNHDGLTNLIDITYLIRFLYHDGPPPPQD